MKTKDIVKTPGISGSLEDAIQLRDTVRFLRGRFKATVEQDGSAPTVVFDDPNMIVDGAKKILAYLVATAPTNNRITTLQLGTMGHGPDILTPVPPLATDSSLNDPAPFSVERATYEFGPTGVENQVTFTFNLEKPYGNGTGVKAYTEAGLFVQEGTMFARETFPAIVKNSTRRIVFAWTIIF